MHTRPIRFLRRGEPVSLPNVPPTRMLLELLREDLGATGTKEGCGEGDCGACTVVLAEEVGGRLKYSAINSCIRPAHSIDGLALWTVEDLAGPSGLHPAQQAMVDCHGSQCGFCTPGFVMSLFGMYQNHVQRGRPVTLELAQEELSGNLCRCTGYRPILDAAQTMNAYPRAVVDEATVLAGLRALRKAPQAADAGAYLRPDKLADLLRARSQHPKAQLVAGCTDAGLWITKQHRQFDQLLDVTRAAELRRIETYPHHIAIGAAVSLTEAYAALVHERPQIAAFARRFAGLPVRNAGTLGGNVANGSPIGDSMPLLIALGASVVLMHWNKGRIAHRELRLEDLYVGYRQNRIAADEVLAWIKVPRPVAGELMRVYKVSKRWDDDISAVCLALRLRIENGVVREASLGAGGVAAIPARAVRTEALLLGRPWNQSTVNAVMDCLRTEFQPISDMRASADYRRHVLGSLLQRLWLESQGGASVELESGPPA